MNQIRRAVLHERGQSSPALSACHRCNSMANEFHISAYAVAMGPRSVIRNLQLQVIYHLKMLLVPGDHCKIFLKGCSCDQRIKDSKSVGFSIPLQQTISRIPKFEYQQVKLDLVIQHHDLWNI